MNQFHELLLPELAEQRMAERQAEAANERRIRELRAAAGSTRWTVSIRLRLPTLRHGAATAI